MISLDYYMVAFLCIGLFICGLMCGWVWGYTEFKIDAHPVEHKDHAKPHIVINNPHTENEINLATELWYDIKHSTFEPGFYSVADYSFHTIVDNHGYNTAINAIHHLIEIETDDCILEGALHVISHADFKKGGYDVEEIYDFVVDVCEIISKKIESITCYCKESVIDAIIDCIEHWDTPKALPMLEGLEISGPPWLRDYRDKVVNYIKEDNDMVGD